MIEKLEEFTDRTVCIIKFNNERLDANGPGFGRFFQVTIDPSAVSPCGKFILFGGNDGDEIIGWQRIDWLSVESVLGCWEDGKKPSLKYQPDKGVTMLLSSETNEIK